MIYSQVIIIIASVITALEVIFRPIFSVQKWYLKKEKNEEDIKLIKEEQIVLTKGIFVCLDCLEKHSSDGHVTEAIKNIEDYLNKQAHK